MLSAQDDSSAALTVLEPLRQQRFRTTLRPTPKCLSLPLKRSYAISSDTNRNYMPLPDQTKKTIVSTKYGGNGALV